jgi:hypothetical protein
MKQSVSRMPYAPKWDQQEKVRQRDSHTQIKLCVSVELSRRIKMHNKTYLLRLDLCYAKFSFSENLKTQMKCHKLQYFVEILSAFCVIFKTERLQIVGTAFTFRKLLQAI